MPLRHKVFAASLLVLLPLLAGCGALFGQRYTNFTAYYNTFYNARQAFEREEREILRADEVVDRSLYLSVFIEPTSTRSSPNLENAIRRGADVLRDHPDSRWVDDALLLIGKSYHYQGNYDAAAQKFREVLSLEVPRLTDEAYLWLGRSLMGAMNLTGAADVLREGLGRETVHPRWAARMHLALGEALVRQGDLEAAVAELHAGLDGVDDGRLEARGFFLLGQTLEAIGEHAEAATAFRSSLQSRPLPELEYAAALQHAIALTHAEQHDQALSFLDRMRRDDRYFTQRGEVETTRARVLAAAGRPDEAASLIKRLLYDDDPNLRVNQIRGQVHYYLGSIYRDHLQNYRAAAVHFDTSATALRGAAQTGREVRRTREAILDAERMADSYGSYAVVRERLVEMDSLLHLGSLDEDAFAAAIEEIAAQRHEELLRQEEERRRIQEQQGFGGMAGMTGSEAGGVAGGGENGGPAASYGFLNYENPVRVQESLIAFQSRWGDRAHVPNWRRAAAVRVTGGPDDDDPDAIALGETASSPEVMMAALVDFSDVPRDEETQVVMRTERAIARYELGNVLFLTLEDPAAAEHWYQLVLDEDPDSQVAARARYALAELYAALEDVDRADELFREIAAREQEPELSAAARQRIGLPALELPPDSARIAENAYEEAYEAWQQNEYEAAMAGMLDLDLRFRPSDVAARALLAAALIYTDWANGDTLLLLAGAPDALVPPDAWAPYTPIEDLEEDEGDAIDEPFELLEENRGWSGGDPDEVPQGRIEDSGGDVIPTALTEEPGLPEPANENPTGSLTSDNGLPPDDPESQVPAPVDPPTAASIPSDTLTTTIPPNDIPPTAGDTQVAPDSLAIESSPISLDTLGTPLFDLPQTSEPTEPWLLAVYDSIIADYPQSPFAQRSQALRTAIAEIRDEHFMSLGLMEEEREVEPDSVPPPDDPFVGLMGHEPIESEAGGFTWRVAAAGGARAARNQLLAFQNGGYRVALLPDHHTDEFFLLLGQFESGEEALAAAGEMPAGVDVEMAEVIPLDATVEIVSALEVIDSEMGSDAD